jgi:hypothetical protein
MGEHYYFIQKNGVKHGPFKLKELELQTIFFDQLIWRSDDNHWKKACEFEELQNNLIINPPPTPKEQKIDNFNNTFNSKGIKLIILVYLLTSILVSSLSYFITQTSWEKYLKDTGGKYLINNQASTGNEGRPPLITQKELQAILDDPKTDAYDELNAYSAASDFRRKDDGFITYKELNDNKRYPIYTRGINNETSHSSNQGFLFRPFKAFYSTIYLTPKEQKNSASLFINLTLQSLLSLLIVFFIFSVLYYAIMRVTVS